MIINPRIERRSFRVLEFLRESDGSNAASMLILFAAPSLGPLPPPAVAGVAGRRFRLLAGDSCELIANTIIIIMKAFLLVEVHDLIFSIFGYNKANV